MPGLIAVKEQSAEGEAADQYRQDTAVDEAVLLEIQVNILHEQTPPTGTNPVAECGTYHGAFPAIPKYDFLLLGWFEMMLAGGGKRIATQEPRSVN